MKLIYDGPPAYSPTLGLDLVPGEHEYPEDRLQQLLALGLKRVKPKAEKEKE